MRYIFINLSIFLTKLSLSKVYLVANPDVRIPYSGIALGIIFYLGKTFEKLWINGNGQTLNVLFFAFVEEITTKTFLSLSKMVLGDLNSLFNKFVCHMFKSVKNS